MPDEQVTEPTEEENQDEFEAAFNEHASTREEDPVEEDIKAELEEDPAEEAAVEAEEDPYKGWPPEAVETIKAEQEARKQLEHRAQSDSGRIGALQRKLNSVTSEIETIRNSSAKAQPSDQQVAEAMAGSDKDWDEFASDYPEIAGAIDRRFENERQQTTKTITPIVEKMQHEAEVEAQTDLESRYEAVSQTFPTWQNAVKESTFNEFMADQPPGIQALANSDDPRDASELIGKYDAYRVANGMETLKAVPDKSGDTEKANQLAQRRAQQLEDGATIPSRSARVDPSAESGDDFEAAFNAYAARRAAK